MNAVPLEAEVRDAPGAGIKGDCELPDKGPRNLAYIIWMNHKCS